MLKAKISAAMPEEMKRDMTSAEGEIVCEKKVPKNATPRDIARMVVDSIGDSIKLSPDERQNIMKTVDSDVMSFRGEKPALAERQKQRQDAGARMRQ